MSKRSIIVNVVLVKVLVMCILLPGCSRSSDGPYYESQENIEIELSFPLSREDVVNYLDVKTNHFSGIFNPNVWVSREIFPASFHQKYWWISDQILEMLDSPEYDYWLVVAENTVYYRWFYVNPLTGEYVELERPGKPAPLGDNINDYGNYFMTRVRSSNQGAQTNTFPFKTKPLVEPTRSLTSNQNGHLWAIILNGAYNTASNFMRYWNDCSFMYTTLVDYYQYDPNHIYVLMSDGLSTGLDMVGYDDVPIDSDKDLNNDGYDDIDLPATRFSLTSVFSQLSSSLGEDDQLFIFISDHGVTNMIYLWGESPLSRNDFNNYLSQIPEETRVICVMNQCQSASMIYNNTRDNTVFITSCGYDENAYVLYDNNNNPYHSAFAYYFASALRGEDENYNTINADYNNDGHVSFYEAYGHAAPLTTSNAYSMGYDQTPEYHSYPSTLGELYDLSGTEIMAPSLEGSSILGLSTSNYFVSGIPSGVTVSWSAHPSISLSSASGSTTSACSTGTVGYCGDAWISATLYESGIAIQTLTKIITVWSNGVFYQNEMISGNLIDGSGSFSLPSNLVNNTSYMWGCTFGEPEFQGYYFTDFQNLSTPAVLDSYEIWVSMTNPFGGTTTLIKTITSIN